MPRSQSKNPTPIEQLETFGPDRCDVMTVDQARAWCRRLANAQYENFSVLSSLVPTEFRDDFAAVYAFCRWADDLGDEIGDPARSLELLAWWRRELQQCYDDAPRHPVFLALAPTIRRAGLPMSLFDDLIQAFEQDQRVTRYATWDDVIEYCRLSANPVGRLVLLVLGEPVTDETGAESDAICTALQLTNHWQDVRRDLVDRDRIYIPAEMNPIESFETRLRDSAAQEYAVDRAFLGETRVVIKRLVERTWPYFELGDGLPSRLSRRAAPIIWLFAAGGQHVLRSIELWNYETALHRPRLKPTTKVSLVAQAWIRSRFGLMSNGTAREVAS